MRTWLQFQKTHLVELPDAFREDDVRYSEGLVAHFLEELTRPGDIVFDPFAGYGTTLVVAEAMGRVPFGIEFDVKRVEYIKTRLKHPENVINGDSRQLTTYDLPPFDFSITSPPYMNRHDKEDPFTAYTREGTGYAAYLEDIASIYGQMGALMKSGAHAVVEVANLKGEQGVTTLAWDVAAAISRVLTFEGEIIACWDRYGYGYDHSYCLLFTR